MLSKSARAVRRSSWPATLTKLVSQGGPPSLVLLSTVRLGLDAAVPL